jgi:hypothetical protein
MCNIWQPGESSADDSVILSACCLAGQLKAGELDSEGFLAAIAELEATLPPCGGGLRFSE